MMIDVRPRSSVSNACSIRISLGRSMFDVASSRIRIRGSASSARAIEISCRSPADSPAPPSRTTCSRPSSNRAATRSTPIARAAAATSSSVASGRAEADVVGDRAAEEERILEHDAELAPVPSAAARRAGRCRRCAPHPRADRRSARSASPWSTCRLPTRRRGRCSPPPGFDRDPVDDGLGAVGEDDPRRARGGRRCGRSRRAPACR